MDIENSKQREIETIEEEWVINSQNDRVVRKYFQVILKWLLHNYYTKIKIVNQKTFYHHF